MRKKLLFSMLLLFVGVSMQAQSIAAEQMDEQTEAQGVRVEVVEETDVEA